jgi:hypothetical protein
MLVSAKPKQVWPRNKRKKKHLLPAAGCRTWELHPQQWPPGTKEA